MWVQPAAWQNSFNRNDGLVMTAKEYRTMEREKDKAECNVVQFDPNFKKQKWKPTFNKVIKKESECHKAESDQ